MKTDLEVEVEVDLRHLGKVIIFRDKQTDRSFPLYIDAYILSAGCQTRARPRLFQTIICLIVSLMTLQAHTGYTLRARYGSDDLTPGNTHTLKLLQVTSNQKLTSANR